GVMGAVASFGALAAPAAALTASYITAVTTATLSVVSLAADVASIALLATGNENAGRILGFVGMATGLASAAPSIAGAAAKGVKKVGKFVGGWQHKLQHAGGLPGGGRVYNSASLKDLAFNKSDPRGTWLETRNMNPSGGARDIMRSAAERYAMVSGETSTEVRRFYSRNPTKVILRQNNVPSATATNLDGSVTVPIFQNNPDYVNEVRQIAIDQHPSYPASILGDLNINVDSLKITAPDFTEMTYVRSQRWDLPAMSDSYQYMTHDGLWMIDRSRWHERFKSFVSWRI
ncbi:hypothetical protein, partial [Pseudomonas versuta]